MFNIRELIKNVMELNDIVFQIKGVELLYKIDNTLPKEILSDKYRIRQILINLISNAEKFTVNSKS